MIDGERASQETILELKNLLDTTQDTLQNTLTNTDKLKIELNQANEKVKNLEILLESGVGEGFQLGVGTGLALGVKIPKGDESDSSEISSDSALSSFVVVGEGAEGRGQGQGEGRGQGSGQGQGVGVGSGKRSEIGRAHV